ncbi:glycosyltransferase [Thermodesulfobacteriota bacterium]
MHFMGYVGDKEKWDWLKGAEALLLSFFMEGFGLTGLEAIKTGIHAVVSDISVFRELYTDAVEYVDPYSPEGIARVI